MVPAAGLFTDNTAGEPAHTADEAASTGTSGAVVTVTVTGTRCTLAQVPLLTSI
ncbi:hypothetical protein D3C87_1500090 [compost metagenome]